MAEWKKRTVDVIDAAGIPRNVRPVDAREIITNGGKLAKRRKPKKYHFRDKEGEPFYYRSEYLKQIDLIAPEVSRDLFSLLPLRDKVFGEGLFPQAELITYFCESDPHLQILTESGELERLDILFHISRNGRFLEIRESELTPAESKLLKDFFDLRDQYLQFCEKYYLTTEWLRGGFFNLLSECSNQRREKLPLGLAHSFSYFVASGDPFQFEFDGWKIDRDSDGYKEIVARLFTDQLDEYVERTAERFRKLGYRGYGRPPEYEGVKWLVLWNLGKLTKAQILRAISKERPSTMTEDQLNERSRELESKYDLPNRRTKRGKSSRQKGR